MSIRLFIVGLFLVVFLAFGLGGCGASVECQTQQTCAACLGQRGCNWTGGQCSNQCLMDTSCYGPGNPAAASCPTGEAAERAGEAGQAE